MNNIQNYSHIMANKYLLLLLPLMAASASAGEQPEFVEAAASPDLLTSLDVTLTHSGTTGVTKITEGLGKFRRWFDPEQPNVLHIALGNQQTGEGMEPGIYRLTARAEYGTGVTAEVTLDIIVPDVTGDGVDEVAPMPLRANDTMLPAGGGGGMEQIVLGYNGTHITHDGEVLTFEQVKELVEDNTKLVYLEYNGAKHLPSIDVQGIYTYVYFYAAYYYGSLPYIERITVNADRVRVDNIKCAVYTNNGSVTIGAGTSATGACSFAEGVNSKAFGNYSHAEGEGTMTRNTGSHAEGYGATAGGNYSHAEGYGASAGGNYSHAEGDESSASGESSHAEGNLTYAGGKYSHAEGQETTATGFSSHTEGVRTTATGTYSHAEGNRTSVVGSYSHVEGYYTEASGLYTHAEGMYNRGAEFSEESGVFMHGCGTSNTYRKNAFAIASDGKVYVIGLGGYDGTNHTEALSLQELLGLNNIQAASNKAVNGHQVPSLTVEQVTQAYNAVVSGRPMTITDATGNYHLSVMQADNLSGELSISIIYLNVMLVSYTIVDNAVDIQFKNL